MIGQPLAMEGMFAFFLESIFLGVLLYGAGGVPRRLHGVVGGLGVRSARGSRASSSSQPTHGCSTRSATRIAPTGMIELRASGRCCSRRWLWWQFRPRAMRCAARRRLHRRRRRRVLSARRNAK